MVTMNESTVPVSRIVSAVRALVDRFQLELTGPRQATRAQMIQFLARELGIGHEAATKLFDDLRRSGVILRGADPNGDEGLPEEGLQQWLVNTEHADGRTV